MGPIQFCQNGQAEDDVKVYFLSTGFYDLMITALSIAKSLGYSRHEIVEAICKVSDKAKEYPPTKNRTTWFITVYKEKLAEARAELLACSLKERRQSLISRRTDRLYK